MGRKVGLELTVEEEMFAPTEHRTPVAQSSASHFTIHLEMACSLESNNKRNKVFSWIILAQLL
jgi:hypothetical protein